MGKFSGTKIPRELATRLLEFVTGRLEENDVHYIPAGSYRRGKDPVGDLDFIIFDYRSDEVIKFFEDVTEDVGRAGPKVASLVLKFEDQLVQVEFNNCPPESKGAYMMHSTGSGLFNVVLRTIAKKKGFFLNQYGLYHEDTRVRVEGSETEEGLLNVLGFKFIEPCDRSVDSHPAAYGLLKRNAL